MRDCVVIENRPPGQSGYGFDAFKNEAYKGNGVLILAALGALSYWEDYFDVIALGGAVT